MKQSPKDYSDTEIERRRDEVVRRMANTPPQPKVSPRSETKRKVGAGRAAHKAPARRGD